MSKISRLPRRFDAVMKTLRELMTSRNERTRLAAVLRASEILLEHQREETRAAVAMERAAARKAEAQATGQPGALPAPQSAEEAARVFLASLTTSEESHA